MNPSYRRRFCGILAAACMLTAATVPAVSPVFSQVSLSVAAAEETDFYKGLKYLKYSDYAEVIDCDQTRTTIKIPSSIGGLPVRVIAERAFYGCKSLETVTGGGNVQVIAPNAFSSCTALTSIGAMDSLQSIGSSAFSDCVSLSNIPSSQSLKSIGDLAFFNCVSLQSVAIPATLTTLGENVFGDCISLQTFAVENGNTSFSVENDVLMNAEKTTLFCYPPAKTGTTYSVPNTVTEIAPYAFASAADLTDVTLLTGLQTIGAWAFSQTKLTSITIPNTVTTIGSYAFCNAASLKQVQLPNSLQELQAAAFWGCSSLEQVTLPNTLQEIPIYAFYGCTGLQKLTVPSSVQTIASEAFQGMSQKITVACYQNSYAETYFQKIISSDNSQGRESRYTLQTMETPTILKGDANQNGEVNVEDAVFVLQYYAKKAAGNPVSVTEAVYQAMNVDDSDDQIDVSDAVKILTYYAKKAAGQNPDWNF